MNATITTAARRIVRTARTRPAAHTRLYFAADGELIAAIAGPEAFAPRSDTYAICVDRTITQADAQAQLDAYAAAIADGVSTADRMGLDGAIGYALQAR